MFSSENYGVCFYSCKNKMLSWNTIQIVFSYWVGTLMTMNKPLSLYILSSFWSLLVPLLLPLFIFFLPVDWQHVYCLGFQSWARFCSWEPFFFKMDNTGYLNNRCRTGKTLEDAMLIFSSYSCFHHFLLKHLKSEGNHQNKMLQSFTIPPLQIAYSNHTAIPLNVKKELVIGMVGFHFI